MRRVALFGGGALLAACALLLWLLVPLRGETDAEREAAKRADPKNGELGAPALGRDRARGDVWAREQDLSGPLELAGLVVDEANAPVAGATVTVASRPPRSVTTAADGTWSVKDLLPRPYRIEAQKDDAFGRIGNVVPETTPRRIVIRLALGAGVRVRVVEAGTLKPITGARVQIRDAESSAAVTDDTGWVLFRGMPPVSAVVITASKTGFATAHQMVGAGLAGQDPHAFHVELKRAGQLAGRVVDQSGRAVANATVVAVDPTAGTPTSPATDGVRSDARGEFVLSDVALGDVQLKAYHPDFRAGGATLVTVTPDASARVVLTLRRAVSVIGHVVDDQGQPAAWAEVHAYVAKQPMWDEAGGRHLVADGTGMFRIDGLPPTSVRIVASTANAASSKAREIDLSANRDVDDVTLVVDLQGSIAGTVVDGHHNPVANVAVTCRPLEGKRVVIHCPGFETTDDAGHFELRGLPAGSYKLIATRPRGAHPAAELTARVGDPSVELAVGDVATVTGKLQLSDGGAPLHARVELQPGGIGVACAGDGSFTISQLDPGAYVLLASGEFVTKHMDGVHVSGPKTDLGVITVEHGHALEGVVVDSSGNPVPDARVVAGKGITDADLKDSLGVNLTAQSIFTDALGQFRIGGLPSDATIAIADHSTLGRSLPTPVGGDAPLRLVLHAPGSLEGVVAGLEHGGGCFVALKPKDTTGLPYGTSCDEHGRYKIARMTEGEYRVELQGPGKLNGLARDITVVAGQAMRVDF